MWLIGATVVAFCCCSSGCSKSKPSGTAPVSTSERPVRVKRRPSHPGEVAVYVWPPTNPLLEAYGIVPLEEDDRRLDDELRMLVRTHVRPAAVFRIIKGGDSVSGEIFVWWAPEDGDESEYGACESTRRVVLGRSSPIDVGRRGIPEPTGDVWVWGCRLRPRKDQDWQALLAELERLGVWEAPGDPPGRRTGLVHGDGFRVQLLRRGQYREYSYYGAKYFGELKNIVTMIELMESEVARSLQEEQTEPQER
jgi:hypothetical protein